MNRPLTPHERLECECINLEGAQTPALANLIAVTMLQIGMVVGGYPTARVRVKLHKDDAIEALTMQVTMTVPLEELGA